MTEQQVRTLFQSDTLRIEDYRCRGQQADHEDEECAERHEIVLPRAGTFVRRDASGSIVADVNQILFFHAEQPYQISHPVTGGDRSTVFVLSHRALMDLIRAFDPSVDDRQDRPFPAGYMLVRTQQRLVQYQLLETVEGITSLDPLAVEEDVLGLLGDIIRDVFLARGKLTRQIHPTTARAHADLTHHTRLIVNAHFRESCTLDMLARAVHTSPYHLSRVFRRETGLSIHRYRQRVRLFHALERLAAYSDGYLTDLALDLGFSSHSHFSTAFRQEFGLTPSQFRQQMTATCVREMRKILKV